MKRSALLVIAAVAVLTGVVACGDSTFLCAGECTATDGGVVSIDQNINAGSIGDATTACYQQLTTLAGQTCTASNSVCACATQ